MRTDKSTRITIKARRCWLVVLAALALEFQLAIPMRAVASTVVPLSPRMAMEVGGVAFAGTVTRITYEREPKGAIITRVVLQKLEMIKGLVVGDSIVLRLAGGALGARRAYVDGQPTFELARRYVLIASGGLGSPDDWFLPIIGMHGGFFPVEEDKRTGIVCVHDWTHRPLVSAREDQILVEDVRGDTARVAPIGTVPVPIVVVGREMSKGNRVTEREFVALLKSLAKRR